MLTHARHQFVVRYRRKFKTEARAGLGLHSLIIIIFIIEGPNLNYNISQTTDVLL